MTLAKRPDTATIEQVILGGDLGTLTPDQRMSYYSAVCQSLGLNPLTKPFQYIYIKQKDGERWVNKLTLYATRDCTDQLRNINHISTEITSREMVNDIYVVTAKATKGDRVDESIGAVSVLGLKGDALANAMMKTETKAKRRVTLSINGLGVLDETEISSIQDASMIDVDHVTGEITSPRQNAIAAPTHEPVATQPAMDDEGRFDEPDPVWSYSAKELLARLTGKRDELGLTPEILKEQAHAIGLDDARNIKPNQYLELMAWMEENYGAEGSNLTQHDGHTETTPKSEIEPKLPDVVVSAPKSEVTIPDVVGQSDSGEEEVGDSTQDPTLNDLQKSITDDYTWDQAVELASKFGIRTRGALETQIMKMPRQEWEALDGTAATAARRLIIEQQRKIQA